MNWVCGDSPASKVGGTVRDQFCQRSLEHLREREHRSKRRVCRIPRPRLTLFVLLIRVPREARSVCHIFLTQPGTLPRRTERGREALGVRAPLRFNLIVPSGHLPSVATGHSSYGLIGMA